MRAPLTRPSLRPLSAGRAAAAILAALAVGAAAPAAAPASAAASADSLVLTTGSQSSPVEDARFEVRAVGTTAAPRDLLVRIRESEGAPCPADPVAGLDAISGRVDGAFSAAQAITITDPGAFQLCGWLLDEGGKDVRARGSLPLVVRPAKAGLGISASSLAVTGRRIRFTAYGGSELARYAFFSLRPATLGCTDSTARGDAGAFGRLWQVEGPFAASSSFDPVAEPADLVICGAVMEADGDPDPEATALASIHVSDRADACRTVSSARIGLRHKMARALRSYRRNRTLARRHPSRTVRHRSRMRSARARFTEARDGVARAKQVAAQIC